MCEYLKALQKPFPATDIEWRVDRTMKTQNGVKAIVLAYVTNRAIMERLDEVFGIAGWKNDYQEWRDKGVLCTISCKVKDEWISKSDGADATNYESTKGGFSASMKRAAVQWGIGRYLYNLDQAWVDVKSSGQNYIKAKVKVQGGKEEWVTGYWDTPKLPTWSLPEGYEAGDPPPQMGEHIEFGDEDAPPEEPKETVDEVAARRLREEKQKAEKNAQGATEGEVNPDPITEGQKKMFFVQAKIAGFNLNSSEGKETMWELLSAHLARKVFHVDHLHKKEFNKVLEFFKAQKTG